MVSFPNCKINLGLNIIRKRPDGYHDLETVFYPVPIHDVLEIIPAGTAAGPQVQFTSSGLAIDGAANDNLCLKAIYLLQKDFPGIPAIKIHLHKNIPMGAGLGGGSADAAFTLKLLNEKFNLSLSTAQLISYALQLGSDCPFFMLNKPCFANGRGEGLTQIDLNLSAYKLVIVNPGIHINTGWAFSRLLPARPGVSIKDIIQQPVEAWKDSLVNDFEKPVSAQYPVLATIKEQLYNMGAIYAAMSGSGSTFFGLFKNDSGIDTSVFPETYFVQTV